MSLQLHALPIRMLSSALVPKFSKVLESASQVAGRGLQGGMLCHPWMRQSSVRGEAVSGLHHQQLLNEIFSSAAHGNPRE